LQHELISADARQALLLILVARLLCCCVWKLLPVHIHEHTSPPVGRIWGGEARRRPRYVFCFVSCIQFLS
jgi:hypothetical protein